MKFLEFPPYNPYLSIIENNLTMIKRELVDVKDTIETKEQLFKDIQTIFYNSNNIFDTIQNTYQNYSKENIRQAPRMLIIESMKQIMKIISYQYNAF
ncbi:hypothetical protein TTHERM_000066729 (macronuclear) [Tetrahymena thermophila SB210]|uniref:Uncharacterized protein n=1 Tax=Tetrahymena thermophila (strain SB210) TaxID=312017 RepID=W7XLK9_TETTS|nr:hypothetical protein TTHERM_000066729 [Tetrahymena thermophila SB210]EWS76469.1 hypothetical protein TTHERM_000066729 [Tetrahymena thermophila SB210]|eukprot:XP_012650996.1 hypothetical protein TTHERM_000066729 [Tetrahymena thermophila SB210]